MVTRPTSRSMYTAIRVPKMTKPAPLTCVHWYEYYCKRFEFHGREQSLVMATWYLFLAYFYEELLTYDSSSAG